MSPTHIHEFKSADRIYTQPPVMSLYLPDQKLGSRSQPGSSSHKFVIKGRQTGSMHRGHTWVFRAETYETMLAWYDDIKSLTEKTGEERNAFVRRHASVRSTSAHSNRSASSDGGLEEDEADAIPYSANQSMASPAARDESPQRSARPSPGGRFPSDLNVNRNLQAPLSPSSGSSEVGNDLTTAAGGFQQNAHPMYSVDPSTYQQPVQNQYDNYASSYVNPYPPTQQQYNPATEKDYFNASGTNPYASQPTYAQPQQQAHNAQDGNYDWIAPAAGGAAAGVLASEAYKKHNEDQQAQEEAQMREQQQQQYSAEPPRTMGFLDNSAATTHQPHYAPDQIDDAGHVAQAANTEHQPQQFAPDQIDDAGHVAQAPAAKQSTSLPVPIVVPLPSSKQTERSADTGLLTPATSESFLDDSEVGMSPPFGKTTVNGGPVPVELIETAQAMAHPGVARQNTDISVSDLHIPGEFPKNRAAPKANVM